MKIWFKQKTRLGKNYEWFGKAIKKKIGSKKSKYSKKIEVKMAHVNKKPQAKKANFCSNTVFSLYIKIKAKKYYAAKPLAFSLHFPFPRDQNHYSNLTSKIMKMCK